MNRLLYVETLKSIRDSVPADRRDQFDLYYAARDKDPAVALVLSFVFGSFGIDRFYLGHIILGILKLITFGGFFIWTIIDWFLIMGSTRKTNVAIATELRKTVG
jgi:TM2 domain-containing membrane protein YozV